MASSFRGSERCLNGSKVYDGDECEVETHEDKLGFPGDGVEHDGDELNDRVVGLGWLA